MILFRKIKTNDNAEKFFISKKTAKVFIHVKSGVGKKMKRLEKIGGKGRTERERERGRGAKGMGKGGREGNGEDVEDVRF